MTTPNENGKNMCPNPQLVEVERKEEKMTEEFQPQETQGKTTEDNANQAKKQATTIKMISPIFAGILNQAIRRPHRDRRVPQ
jgi:hypothetical protein